MALTWNGQAAILEIYNATAQGLLNASAYFQAHYRQMLSTPYPPASRPGQYPHYRSGHGWLSVDFDPQTVSAVAQSMTIRLGYNRSIPPGMHWSYGPRGGTTPPSYYMVALEISANRSGLAAAAAALAPGIAVAALGAARQHATP